MRWITFTRFFPNASFPALGPYTRERLRSVLRRSPGDQAAVVAPVPWFPLRGVGGWARWARVPRVERDGTVEVFHPPYPLVPRISAPFEALLIQTWAGPSVRRLAPGASLIDAHFLYPDAVAAVRIGRRLKLPVVLTVHGSELKRLMKRRVVRTQIQNALREAAAVVTVSRELRQRLATETGFPEDHIEVIPNGVDRGRFHPGDRAAARHVLGLATDDRILLTAARLVPNKRVDLLVEALARLRDSARPLLLCVGGGPDRQALERKARQAGVGDRVRFAGEQRPDEMPRWYQAADAFALATDREGCPNVLLEAIASGLPVLASSVGGMPEIVDADVGLLVAENSADAFAAGIEELARRRFDPAAFQRHAAEHSSELMGHTVHALFRRVAANASRTGSDRANPA